MLLTVTGLTGPTGAICVDTGFHNALLSYSLSATTTTGTLFAAIYGIGSTYAKAAPGYTGATGYISIAANTSLAASSVYPFVLLASGY